ncbi:hypothetical protein J7T55_015641 [Diaporthe amygdali]|uniref:uncharacterized protein n=1 Tax=Phomopsis amygdali TaxID=1214568 RepID=UPI0022FE2B6B|nr:uncharacterized protein J7T55_015641 [Diaporthe amygdali]KAJ0120903.1 hypothetical protein J7T55_015641 [Diaporthe amygdali]
MSNSFTQCIHGSDMIVSENITTLPSRPALKFLPYLTSIASNTTCDTILFRNPHRGLVLPYNPLRISRLLFLFVLIVLLACVGPVWHSGCAEQNRAGNGPEKSTSGGCNPGMGVYGALDSLEKGHSPWEPNRPKRKRGSDRPQHSKASSRRKTAPSRHIRRTFACHYYLHDRIGYCDCLSKRLKRLSDVRQHLLERTHKQVVHCPVCGVTFTEQTVLARQRRDAHVQAATCERSQSPFNYPGITEDEEQQIRNIARNGRTTQYTEVQRWYMIWDVLFPGEERPASPFLTEVPEIQRMLDQRDAVFIGSDLWLNLPRNQPWTTEMPLEEQQSAMYNFVGSFIGQARGVVEQNEASVEDDPGTDIFSLIDVDAPDASDPPVNLGITSLPSFRSSIPLDASEQAYVNSFSITPSAQALSSHPPSQMDSNPGGQPPAISTLVPPQLVIDPAPDISQDTQQRAASGPVTDTHDPTFPYLPLLESSTDDFAMEFSSEWPMYNFGNDDTAPGNDCTPAGEDELGGRA